MSRGASHGVTRVRAELEKRIGDPPGEAQG